MQNFRLTSVALRSARCLSITGVLAFCIWSQNAVGDPSGETQVAGTEQRSYHSLTAEELADTARRYHLTKAARYSHDAASLLSSAMSEERTVGAELLGLAKAHFEQARANAEVGRRNLGENGSVLDSNKIDFGAAPPLTGPEPLRANDLRANEFYPFTNVLHPEGRDAGEKASPAPLPTPLIIDSNQPRNHGTAGEEVRSLESSKHLPKEEWAGEAEEEMFRALAIRIQESPASPRVGIFQWAHIVYTHRMEVPNF